MSEPVRQRRGEVPCAAVLFGGVRGGDEPHPLTEVQISDAVLLHDSHQRVLGGRGGGVYLVEEHQRHSRVLSDAARPLRRRIHHRAAVAHRQPTEVRRIVQRRDQRLHRPARLNGVALNGGRLARARVAPQQHRHPRRQKHLHRLQRLPLCHSHRLYGHVAPSFSALLLSRDKRRRRRRARGSLSSAAAAAARTR